LSLVSIEGHDAVAHEIGENGVARQPIPIGVEEMSFPAEQAKTPSRGKTGAELCRIEGRGKEAAGRPAAPQEDRDSRAAGEDERRRRGLQRGCGEDRVGQQEEQRGQAKQMVVRQVRDLCRCGASDDSRASTGRLWFHR
jgi:hypothetical protein